jgi:hypothetical protein
LDVDVDEDTLLEELCFGDHESLAQYFKGEKALCLRGKTEDGRETFVEARGGRAALVSGWLRVHGLASLPGWVRAKGRAAGEKSVFVVRVSCDLCLGCRCVGSGAGRL